eukprot:1139140-Pelagomonas_calceolata.AAC.5
MRGVIAHQFPTSLSCSIVGCFRSTLVLYMVVPVPFHVKHCVLDCISAPLHGIVFAQVIIDTKHTFVSPPLLRGGCTCTLLHGGPFLSGYAQLHQRPAAWRCVSRACPPLPRDEGH